MATEANKTLIGAFIVGALLLAAAGIAVFASGAFFQTIRPCALYFEGSVKGLTLGAPVQMKGVTIGKVTAIQLIIDPKDLSVVNRVVAEISPGLVESSDQFFEDAAPSTVLSEDVVEQLVARGLRAKLVLDSFVTGKLLVSLDFYPDTEARFYGLEAELKELPTLPSDLEELTKSLEQIPFQEMAQTFNRTLAGIENIVTSPELLNTLRRSEEAVASIGRLADNLDRRTAALSSGIDQTLGDVRRLIAGLDRQLAPLAAEVTGAAGDARQVLQKIGAEAGPMLTRMSEILDTTHSSLTELRAVVGNLKILTAEKSPLLFQATEAMRETTAAAVHLRVLADYLSRHPEALIHGKAGTGNGGAP